MNREDYITTIFKIMDAGKEVSNKLLSEMMGIAPSSVTEMLRKLSRDGLVISKKNQITLTEEGLVLAKNIISIHRLWETFLMRVLKYNWRDVHDQADLLEHVTDDRLRDKLNEFLGYPEYCPHGGDIYLNRRGAGEEDLALESARISQSYQIIKVDDNVELLEYLDRIGLRLYDEIKVLSMDNFDGSLRVRMLNQRDISLCKEAACPPPTELTISPKALSHIYVKELTD